MFWDPPQSPPVYSASSESNLGERCRVFGVLQRRHWCLHTYSQPGSSQHWERWPGTVSLSALLLEDEPKALVHFQKAFTIQWQNMSLLPGAVNTDQSGTSIYSHYWVYCGELQALTKWNVNSFSRRRNLRVILSFNAIININGNIFGVVFVHFACQMS